MASAQAEIDFRALLDHSDADALVKGLVRLEPRRRDELRRVLRLADSLSGAERRESRMPSVLQNVENAFEKVLAEVGEKVSEFDGEALSVAREAIVVAKDAEAQVVTVTEGYKNQLTALAEQYGPELAALGEQLLTDVKSLFSVG